MTIQNCKRCDTLYNKVTRDICPKCMQQDEEDYKKVRMYLKRHRTAELAQVSNETGVDLELIYQFLQEGRITLGGDSSTSYPCKQCGASIQTGSLCTMCTNENKEIQKTFQAFSDSSQQQMLKNEEKKATFHARE